MALRDILVHVDHTEDGAARVALAVDLAARHSSSLTVLHVRERSLANLAMIKAAELGLMPAAAMERVEHDIDAKLDAEADQLRQGSERQARPRNVECAFLSIAGKTGSVVAQHARYADLTIVGHGGELTDDMPEGYSFAEAMLFATGRPVIMIPAAITSRTLGHRVALAWNGSRPAARALSDALALIERADATIVLTANLAQLPSGDALPIDAVLAHLRRHGAGIEAREFERPHGEIADALQTEAIAAGADLLVAGAYGHPRMWERLLGGVTRDLLARTRLPLLMSH